MSSKSFFIVMIVLTVVAPALTTDYMVGNSSGWRLDVNYTEWANGKEFHVGDRLMFMYNTEFHNVAKVNGSEFQQCSSTNSSNHLTTGSDTITLGTPGKKWYICSRFDHCDRGMKVVINVASAEAPAPAPTSAATVELSPLKFSAVWIIALMPAFGMMMA